MKEQNRGLAVWAGVLLILFILPIFLLGVLIFYSGAEYAFVSICILLAGVFLIAGKPKLAAAALTLLCVGELLLLLFGGDSAVLGSGGDSQVPQTLQTLEDVFFIAPYPLLALALWLRGWPALLLGLLSSLTQAASLALTFQTMYYTPGHPTPLNLLPVWWIIGAALAGFYLKGLKDNKSTQEEQA